MKRRAETTVTSSSVEFEKVEIKEEYQDDSFESEQEGSSRNLFQEQDFVDPNEFLLKEEDELQEGEEEEHLEKNIYVPADSMEFVDDVQRKNMKTFNFLKYLIAQKQKSVRSLQEKVKEQHATLMKLKEAKQQQQQE